jgi:hypothetical protein
MNTRFLPDDVYDKIFNFWKLEEYFTPSDYPEIILKVREYNKEIPFDAYYNKYSTRTLPLDTYKAHNDYLRGKKVSDEKLYNRANVYCGCYKLKTFVEKMAEECKLDLEKYPDINELSGRFYSFSVQVDLNGNLTEEGVRISPFFYAVVCMIKTKGIHANIMQDDIVELNKDVNEICKQNAVQLFEFEDVKQIKNIIFDILEISTEQEVGLVGATENIFACKGLRKEDETNDFNSFYLDEIDLVHKNYKSNEHVAKYVTALLVNEQQKIMIDSDINAMQKWLDVDKYPLAKYPSKFSPTLMQQVAINIAISEMDRKEKIFSVNGPPGTGKTTLLKEIIASNVEKLAEVLIGYGINGGNFTVRKIESASNPGYMEKYYEIPEDIAQYGILVVSNNNGAVENVTLDLPKADSVEKDNTWTSCFDRREHPEVYFSAVADELLGEQGTAWGLISARMGRRSYVSKVLESCVFAKTNDDPEKVTLDLAKADSILWNDAVSYYKSSKDKVLSLRAEIKQDKQTLSSMYREETNLEKHKSALKELLLDKEQKEQKRKETQGQLEANERNTLNYEEEIEYIKKHAPCIKKLMILFHLGNIGKRVDEKQKLIDELILEHEEIARSCRLFHDEIKTLSTNIEKQNNVISSSENELNRLKELVYGDESSLKNKYNNNLADTVFYKNINVNENSQNACPWTYAEYDKAREELFFAALQVRKAFILESPYIRRNLFVYEAYNNGRYTTTEKMEMFPHLINALSVVVPVLSSTFASVGRFLRYAENQSLGMLVIDESGQATPQSALGAIYRTKRAVVVGDPLQVEPVMTIPQVLVDILADSTGVSRDYKVIENSAQTFADSMNEFNGIIGERQVGCPLVVHRRCIEPMFSISNMISYDNRMFNKTNKKEEFLEEDKPFLIKKSGWIDVKGPENGAKDHFVKAQAEKVCQLLEDATKIYDDLFKTDDKIFIITPFRTVAESMCKYIIDYYSTQGLDKELIRNWTKNCVGTVHTFQGKDAYEVMFVLGCSTKSVGAMNWVVKKANILNVACTRAKYRIAFIGNMDDWKNRQFFQDFVPKLIDRVSI